MDQAKQNCVILGSKVREITVNERLTYKLDYQMDIRKIRELVDLYLKVPFIKQFYGYNERLMEFYAESSMEAWRIGKIKIAQARVNV